MVKHMCCEDCPEYETCTDRSGCCRKCKHYDDGNCTYGMVDVE